MEYNFTSPLVLYCSVILLPVLILVFLKPNKRPLTKLPPSPPGWPVFGHMFHLGTLPYVTMAKMKDKYGPVTWLKLGSVNTMVVQSADAAAELYKNHDLSFSDRPIVETLTSHEFHKSTMIFSSHGPYWLRRKCVDDLLSWIGKEAETAMVKKRGIKIVDFVALANINVIANILFSKDLVEPNSRVGRELFESMTCFFSWGGEPNVSDYFTWLKPFDLQGLKRNMDRDMGKALEIVSGYVKERLEENQQGGKKQKKDLLDILLDFEGNGTDEREKLSEHAISVFLLEMFMAGAEATTSTIEWALAELLSKPRTLTEAKHEILKIVGRNKRFEESDIDKLPFLQAIVKETLRMHPGGGFVPKKASKDTSFMGYDIPKSTNVMINIWAIGRDPEYWSDPSSFKPERFLDSIIDYKGQYFDYIPFGSGSRICPGIPLAQRLVHLILGSLIHEFDWELEDSFLLDMSEKMGLTLRKLEPLKAIPKKQAFKISGMQAGASTQEVPVMCYNSNSTVFCPGFRAESPGGIH
ncbi:oxygenase [Lithospermum erythrorhizon]|uniref:Oxygenase n=1 Tax=Lithospermum erythrorhizon TaxID=34254 RepID=A0AAV3RFM8_LITER